MWLWWNYFAGNKNCFRLLKIHGDVKYCYSDLISIWFHCDTGKSNKIVSVWAWGDSDQRLQVFSVSTDFVFFALLNVVEIINGKYLYCLKSVSFFLTQGVDASCQVCPAHLTQEHVGVHLAIETIWASSAYAELYHASHTSISDCTSTDKILWSLC